MFRQVDDTAGKILGMQYLRLVLFYTSFWFVLLWKDPDLMDVVIKVIIQFGNWIAKV